MKDSTTTGIAALIVGFGVAALTLFILALRVAFYGGIAYVIFRIGRYVFMGN